MLSKLERIMKAGYAIEISPAITAGYVITIKALYGYSSNVIEKEFPKCDDLETGFDEVVRFIEKRSKS